MEVVGRQRLLRGGAWALLPGERFARSGLTRCLWFPSERGSLGEVSLTVFLALDFARAPV